MAGNKANQSKRLTMKKKVLLTGASGLLGSEIVDCLEIDNYELIKLRQTPASGYLSLDIADPAQIAHLEAVPFDYIVHTAANKDPDSCQKDPEGARKINVDGTAALARVAGKKRIPMLFISTDYVFDGTRPPYREEDRTNPLNVYGQTKCDGENAVLSECPQGMVLRVPFLFGGRELTKSTVITSAIAAARSSETVEVEAELIRCPTATYDVARAVKAAIEHDLSGIYHYSGHEAMNRYQIYCAIANLLGLPVTSLKPRTLGKVIAPRPHNARLCIDKWLGLGLPAPEAFPAALQRALKNLQLLA